MWGFVSFVATDYNEFLLDDVTADSVKIWNIQLYLGGDAKKAPKNYDHLLCGHRYQL